MGKQSTNSGDCHYLKTGFSSDPVNQFWNRPTHVVFDPKTGYREVVLESSPKAKAYFEECLKETRKKEAKYRPGSLQEK